MQLLLKKVTIICPTSKHHLKKRDLLIKDGVIEKIAETVDAKANKIIDEKNVFVSVGWMDIFSDFSEPGNEQNEDIQTGTNAALAGGYTDVCLIPNTTPTISSKASIEFIRNKSGIVNLHPIGAISANIEGTNLAEMYDMKKAGAIAFSDGIKPVQQAGLFLKALQYVKAFNGVLIQVPEDISIAQHGLMHEGVMSTQLGLQGKAAIAESLQIQRDLELLSYTESTIHFTGISTKKSVALIKQAKKQGLQVTCSVTPYHLLFTDKALENYDALYKVNPPLRTEDDRQALLKGIEDGTIDCIASHHFPKNWDAKEVEFEYAKNGMIGLQTVLPMLLQLSSTITIEKWISMLTDKPRAIFGLNNLSIQEKQEACLTIFSTDATWKYDAQSNKSKSSNSPYFDQTLQGKILAVINNKEVYIHE